MLADIIIIAFMVLSAYFGYKKGFVRTVSKLISFVISIILAKILHPIISGYIRNSFIGEFINSKIADKADSIITESAPSFIQNAGHSTVNEITDTIVTVLTIIFIIIVTFIAVYFLIKALDLVSRLPVISWLNHLAGFVAGFFWGILLVYTLLAVVVVINPDVSWMENSSIAIIMFKDNYLINIIY